MKFLANENIPFSTVKTLKGQGWEIEHVGEKNMGIRDEEVIEYSIQNNQVIITFDSDYGELVFTKGYKPQGVIYLRIKNFTPEYPAFLLHKLIVEDELEVKGKFTVVSENLIRQRDI